MDKKVSVIIAAAGSGTRMGTDKMLMDLCGEKVILRTIGIFSENKYVSEIIVVASEHNKSRIEAIVPCGVKVITGGSTRGESSQNGINTASGEFVLIHDGARPFVTPEIVNECIEAAFTYGAAAVGVMPKDSIKSIEDSFIKADIKRSETVQIQTPQIFRRNEIKSAYERFYSPEDTDDCAVIGKAGVKVRLVNGSYENIKLTTPEDVISAQSIINKRNGAVKMPFRIGTGFDTHRLSEGRKLIIGGVDIPFEKGLLGHSDADVLIHAIIDALFGACALGNIGQHFPDNDEAYRGVSSMLLLEKCAEIIGDAGYKIGNIDSTIIVQKPKMAPYIDAMRENIATALKLDVNSVSVKAKTNEQMGFTGRSEGIEARATVLVFS